MHHHGKIQGRAARLARGAEDGFAAVRAEVEALEERSAAVGGRRLRQLVTLRASIARGDARVQDRTWARLDEIEVEDAALRERLRFLLRRAAAFGEALAELRGDVEGGGDGPTAGGLAA